MEHPYATTYRRMIESIYERGDFEPFDRQIRDDVIWINDIGAGPWRRLEGKAAVGAMFDAWGELFDGGFRHDVIDVCASDHNVIMILHEVGDARGHRFDNLALYRIELDGEGRAAAITTFDRDREAINDFWAAVGPVSGTA